MRSTKQLTINYSIKKALKTKLYTKNLFAQQYFDNVSLLIVLGKPLDS